MGKSELNAQIERIRDVAHGSSLGLGIHTAQALGCWALLMDPNMHPTVRDYIHQIAQATTDLDPFLWVVCVALAQAESTPRLSGWFELIFNDYPATWRPWTWMVRRRERVRATRLQLNGHMCRCWPRGRTGWVKREWLWMVDSDGSHQATASNNVDELAHIIADWLRKQDKIPYWL